MKMRTFLNQPFSFVNTDTVASIQQKTVINTDARLFHYFCVLRSKQIFEIKSNFEEHE